MKLLAVIFMIVAVLVAGKLEAPTPAQQINDVCGRSQQVIDGALEEQCGALQDQYNIEYRG